MYIKYEVILFMLSKKQLILFKVASTVAGLSNHQKSRLGAIVYNKHKIISSGYNSSTEVDRVQAELDIARYNCYCPGKIHAETSALLPFIKRNIDIRGAELYVSRLKKDNSHGMARPCPSCMRLIRKCGIKRIHYTTDDGFATEVIEY